LITVPVVLRISSTPVTLMNLLLSLRATCLPVLVSLSLTSAIAAGGMFEMPEANWILLGARVELSSLRRRARRGTNAIRSMALLHGAPRSGDRLQVTGSRHREPVQGMGVCGLASELRIDYGPGYRVYFAQRGPVVIVLLAGGDKRTQDRDIETALALARNL
jgi:putative addiction module killer protein